MFSLFTIWALAGVITAMIVPSAQYQTRSPPLPHLDTRGASMPTVENYTGTYLRNNAIQAPLNCQSLITVISFPSTTLYPNITQCHDVCERFSALSTSRRFLKKCRFFNMYMLFQDGVNKGMQCAIYDRRWNNTYATNDGTYDAWGRSRTGTSSFKMSDSFAYYLTSDPGNQTCVAKDSQ